MRIALLIAGLALLPIRAAAADDPEKPTELPPLLKPPPPMNLPATGPRGPNGEYDPGYFYLPERAPDGPRRPAPCGPEGRIWIGPGLELAWMKSAAAPPLLRLGSATGPVIYGGQRISSPMQAGFSLATGVWLNEARTIGFDASFLYLNGTGSDSLIGPTGEPLVLPNGSGSFALADPAAGTVGAFQAGINTLFASADVNSRTNLRCTPNARVDSLIGYRFARLSDDYEVYGKRISSGGEIVRFRDEAHTRNDFHGGQIGLAGELREGRWFVSGSGKIAFGVVFSDTDLEGKYRLNGNVDPVGFYARPGLNGTRERSQYAVMPAANLSVGRQIGEHGRVALGYQFLSLNRVARGPDLLDSASVATGEVVTTGFWVQSFSLTAEWRF